MISVSNHGVVWAFAQPYRLTLLHPRDQGFWWLVVEPQLLVIGAGVLFAVGAYKALTLVGDWRISGLQMTLIGMLSAAAGYGIGRLLHVSGT